MMNYRTQPITHFLILLAATGTLILALAASVQAQRSPIDVFNTERARAREESMRRRDLETLEGNKRPIVTDQRQKLALLAQIKQDFNLIQVNNNEMIRAAFADRTPDYEALSEKAADIKKRAIRLRDSIKLMEPEDEKKNQKNQDAETHNQLKQSLLSLRKSVNKFVTNPLFRNTGVIDVQHSAQASRDLRDIIELSDIIRKGAKRLDKADK